MGWDGAGRNGGKWVWVWVKGLGGEWVGLLPGLLVAGCLAGSCVAAGWPLVAGCWAAAGWLNRSPALAPPPLVVSVCMGKVKMVCRRSRAGGRGVIILVFSIWYGIRYPNK